ncbi:glycosyltransferase family 2 protein [Pseudorhizobium endolithicum]|uniref:Glycosyltransferase family 2 protein n=2 Tax=Pseudorhizobium endolithicum TaxID=1191678 RepID=A0ABN7JMK8_9HYPH|nr:glycosyltransferase family 2 protein [Pseudorhizobium endolithicum]
MDAICVIIAAKNAATTIATAVRSALREPAVAEVIVVDDGSTDETADVARCADDGSGRLNVISFSENRGPAAARNYAIKLSSSPLIAILDADDFFIEGRFDPMLQQQDWDFIADNIVFTTDASGAVEPQPFLPRARRLSALHFIEGNISQPGVRRGEIGFLKPVMRRSFLEAHDLRYDESLRLGEDYDFYLRALLRGARYTIIEHCGYAAVVRADSLSGQHRTEDLRRLWKADSAIRAQTLPPEIDAALARHEKHIRDRYELRAFLDRKAKAGKAAAIRHLLASPGAIPAVLNGVLRDKIGAIRKRAEPETPSSAAIRYLMPGVPVPQK